MKVSEDAKYWFREGIGFSVVMYFIMTFIFPIFFEDEKLTLMKAILDIPLFFVGGICYGFSLHFIEKCFHIDLKRKDSKNKDNAKQ